MRTASSHAKRLGPYIHAANGLVGVISAFGFEAVAFQGDMLVMFLVGEMAIIEHPKRQKAGAAKDEPSEEPHCIKRQASMEKRPFDVCGCIANWHGFNGWHDNKRVGPMGENWFV